jgi:cytochrome oxidase Cu insertion factor (SCO1/SenC/PrrC family)
MEHVGEGKGRKSRFAVHISIILFLPLAACLMPSAFHTAMAAQTRQKAAVYVCPMDRDVKSRRPGKCPKCGMKLRAATSDDVDTKPDVKPSAEPSAARPEASINLARIPDTTVYDQDGRKLRFYADLVKGKTVAINFIFTTCTTICPPLTATFRRVQQELGDRTGRDIELISISVDPTTDVPERLKSFAAKFNARQGWTFVTGSKPEIDLLLAALGAKVANKNDHSPMILIGNEAAGNWTRTYGLASPTTLVKMITDAASQSASEGAPVQVPLPGERAGSQATAPVRAAQQSGETKQAKTPSEAAASYFTNTVLTTQENNPVRFYADLLKGKTVVINFMFTTCKGVCPAMTANLLKVQEYLGARVGKDISMISISVDPAIDTPAALKAYATRFKIKPGWLFLTGEKANVDLILRKLGGYVEDKNSHINLAYIGNVETGQWVKAFAMARPSELADAILKVADAK